MSEFEIKTATRQGAKPLIGLYSESGCGKTYSALLLARGFAGPSGKVVMVDSESGRGSLYADVLPGGYEVLELTEPFSPIRYIAAIQAVEKSGAAIGIIDSFSHEWEGLGGVCEMASDNEQRSGKLGLHNWKQPKMEHARCVLKMLQSSIPWVVCVRAKCKTRQQKDERGKTQIIKDEFVSPIQDENFIFECTAYGFLGKDHAFNPLKVQHPTLAACFPNGKPIEIRHGELLAKWCASSGVAPANPLATQPAKPPVNPLKKELWKLTKLIHGGDPARLQAWIMSDEGLGLKSAPPLEKFGELDFEAVLLAAKTKLGIQPNQTT